MQQNKVQSLMHDQKKLSQESYEVNVKQLSCNASWRRLLHNQILYDLDLSCRVLGATLHRAYLLRQLFQRQLCRQLSNQSLVHQLRRLRLRIHDPKSLGN